MLFLGDPPPLPSLTLVFGCSLLQIMPAPGPGLKLMGLLLLRLDAWTTELLTRRLS